MSRELNNFDCNSLESNLSSFIPLSLHCQLLKIRIEKHYIVVQFVVLHEEEA